MRCTWGRTLLRDRPDHEKAEILERTREILGH
jgi:hypothetical protein